MRHKVFPVFVDGDVFRAHEAEGFSDERYRLPRCVISRLCIAAHAERNLGRDTLSEDTSHKLGGSPAFLDEVRSSIG